MQIQLTEDEINNNLCLVSKLEEDSYEFHFYTVLNKENAKLIGRKTLLLFKTMKKGEPFITAEELEIFRADPVTTMKMLMNSTGAN